MPPVGFKRSRALWDDARRPRDNKVDEWKAFLRALLYELQPIRFSSNPLRPAVVVSFLTTRVFPLVQRIVLWVFCGLLPTIWTTIRHFTLKQWMIIAGVVAYYFVVRWMHEYVNCFVLVFFYLSAIIWIVCFEPLHQNSHALPFLSSFSHDVSYFYSYRLIDAGPLVLILTALATIFTVGLRDKEDGEISAYSVFNRGFQSLMGSVNVEELVNQHVGGGMMMAGADGGAGAGGIPIHQEPQHGGIWRQGNNRHYNNHAEREEARGENHDQDEGDDNDTAAERQNRQARKSGKKARRQNLEERQEQRRQREAARAMGLDGAGGHEEAMAMQRLLEEQVANNNGQ